MALIPLSNELNNRYRYR